MTTDRSTTWPVAPSGPGSWRRLLDRWWPLFVAVWLSFIITGPVTAIVEAPRPPGRLLVAGAWLVTFVAAYRWLIRDRPFIAGPRAAGVARPGSPASRRPARWGWDLTWRRRHAGAGASGTS